MLQERLWLEVDRVASRCRRLRWWRMATLFWLTATMLAVSGCGIALAAGIAVTTPMITRIAIGVALGLWAVSSWIDTFLRSASERMFGLARQIESLFPELNSCLLAAIEQRPESADGRLGFLQESVVRQALNHAATHDWRQVVPLRRIVGAAVVQLVALGLFVLTVINVGHWSPSRSEMARQKSESIQAVSPGTKFTVDVEPGNAEVERGTSLLVLARVTGEMPPDATLIMRPDGGATKDAAESKLALSRSLEDPVFGGRIASVTLPFAYHLELGGQVTPTFRVTVFEYPRLERADARLVYPSYTGLDEKLVQDARTVSVVEGTQVTIVCRLNKRVQSARFVEAKRGAAKSDNESPDIAMPVAELVRVQESDATKTRNDQEFRYELRLTADRSRRLKLELIDDAGRRNVEAFEFSLNVLPNKPPTLKLVQPARDLEVSPLEELDVKATAWDDFGLKRLGLTFAIAGHEPTDVVLSENAAAREKHELANAIKFEELKAEPDQLLSYHFWAEDFGSDGNVRRTSSEMFFAEVRHFEEIFRQGQQPPGGQQQQQAQGENAQTAQQLANSQKDIINATWKVIRREVGPKLTGPFAGDVGQIEQSQQALLEKSQALAEKLKDAQSLEYLEAVLTAMQLAIERLTAAHDGPAAEPLAPALAAEQAAYQALLKLRAREHEVIKQQQQSSSSSSSASARSQQQRQQMDQLDLKENENRYESERQAQQKQESEADRETRQVLNRLRELAQRQHDLNERLKDLQTALQEAATPDRQEEIRQQLKRLQDEQRQMLRDTDELQSRMESAANQERMSEERQKVEQTREDVRRAAESLEAEKVTQATAAGRRAEQQLDELRDEFRRRASNRFSEEVREMRESARELDREQKELSKQLAAVTQPDAPKNVKADSAKADSAKTTFEKTKSASPKSLREDRRADEIVRGLNEQKEKLSGLTERMKQTVQEAEQSEPLLSERLYDAARNVQTQNVDQALEATSRSLQRGLNEDARQVERIAGQGITKLREGVEKAAEAVLGDETESLRRAREELRRLSQALNREIAQNAPQLAPNGELSGDSNQSVPANSEAKSDQPGTPNGEQSPTGKSNPSRKPGQSKSDANSPQSESGQSPSDEPKQSESGQTPDQQSPGQQQDQKSQSPQSGQQKGQPKGQQGKQGQQAGQPEQGQSQQGDQKSDDAKPGQSPGQNSPSQSGQQPGQQQSSQQSSGQRSGQRGQQRSSGPSESTGGGAFDNQGAEQTSAPITGEDFVKWSDRLRDVEEMVDDPALRAEAARIRDQAKAARADFKRHSKEPNWQLIRSNVAEPLAELTNRVTDELLRRNSQKAIVPLDRDPVPPKFSEKTRRYYERLGSGK